MTTPIDPNLPTQWAGETWANFQARLQDYLYKQGGLTGPNQTMAKTFTDNIVSNPAPKGWSIQ
jgi:hypothetical protein